ncbi:MAG: hypothetical protein LUG85_07525, partial [Clostridiales bacterium]|nr:hypothetical protein [Clostridiales bacterium]
TSTNKYDYEIGAVSGAILEKSVKTIGSVADTAAESTTIGTADMATTEAADVSTTEIAVDVNPATVIEIQAEEITLTANTKVTELAKTLDKQVTVTNTDGSELETEALVGTGCKVQVLDDSGEIVLEYTAVVPMDVDGNGKVTAADARIALRVAAGLETVETFYAAAADCDADTYNTPSDARAILRKAANLD